MYDARAIVEAIATAVTDAVEAGEYPHVDGSLYGEDAVVITDTTERAEVGRATEPEAFIMVRTSDGRTWRVYAEEQFI